jgi:hypothetical protein
MYWPVWRATVLNKVVANGAGDGNPDRGNDFAERYHRVAESSLK